MTVTLELTPAQERALQSNAQHEGLALEQYILRRLLSLSPEAPTFAQMQARAAEGFAASGMTNEDLDEYVVQSVKQIRAEDTPDTHP